ncbi:hypothetical protein BSPWISOX_3006 [uncultured Gammaproteobacteria bacterium]|nr:hypothetical protein BSPWISOX_3006 [uncultured Gammaproteobacteria bacterium]
MIVPIYAKVSKGNNVSVAGCLGYDVLEYRAYETLKYIRFSCWLFRL